MQFTGSELFNSALTQEDKLLSPLFFLNSFFKKKKILGFAVSFSTRAEYQPSSFFLFLSVLGLSEAELKEMKGEKQNTLEFSSFYYSDAVFSN